MSISSETRKAGPYTGNGVTVAFPFAFKVFSSADVQVIRTVTDTETVLTLSTHYTVALNADQDANPGGTVTLLTAPAVGSLITIASIVANFQPVVLTNAGGFYPRVLNDALDRLTIIVQQLAEKVSRSVKVNISSSITPDQLVSEIVSAVGTSTAAAAAAASSAAAAAEAVAAVTLPIPVESGGTGATTSSGALSALGIGFRGHIAGLILSTAGSSTTMTVSDGQAADSTGELVMSLAAPIAKTTAAWAVGAGGGGLDAGTIANDTWHHFFVIRRPDTGVVDVLISLSEAAPTLPANYTQFRRIGSAKTNGSGQWVSFSQHGDYFAWVNSVLDITAVNPGGGAAVTAALSVPPGVKVDAIVRANISDSSGPYVGLVLSDLATADLAVDNANNVDALPPLTGVAATCTRVVRTNMSAQIRYRTAPPTSTTVNIRTLGWYDTRGRNA